MKGKEKEKSNGVQEPKDKITRTTQLKMQTPSKPKCHASNGA